MNKRKENLYQLPTNRPERTSAELTPDELSELITLINTHLNESERHNFERRMQEHVGHDATYGFKASVLEGLKIIYDKLKASDTSDSERKMLAIKLHERAGQCSPGFHNGVNAIVDGFYAPKDMNDLLYRVRQDIVLRMASRLTDDVHTNNLCFVMAENAGYGVYALNAEDPYLGNLSDETIKLALEDAFEKELALFPMLQGLEDQLKGQLSNEGYEGSKGSNGAYEQDEYCKIETVLMQLFKDNSVVMEFEEAQDALRQQEESKRILTENVKTSLSKQGLSETNIPVFLNPTYMPLALKDKLQKEINQRSVAERESLEAIKLTYTNGMAAFDENVRLRQTEASYALREALFFFSDEGMTDINWVNVRQMIWQGVKAHQYFHFTENERELLDKLMNPEALDDTPINWSEVIKTLDDFIQAMRYLLPEKREAVFNTMQGDLKGIIGTAGDFGRVMWPLLPWQRAVVIDTMKDNLKDIINTAGDLMRVIRDLSPEQCRALLDVMKDDLKDIIETADNFMRVMRVLSPEQCRALLDTMKDNLKDIINTAGDFVCVMRDLSSEQSEAVFNTMQGDLKGIIGTAGDFRCVMWPLSPEQREAVFNTMKDNLKGIIKTADDFERVMWDLSSEKREAVFDVMKGGLKNIIKTADDFGRVMKFLSPEQCRALLDVMKDDLKDIIETADNFMRVMRVLSSEQCRALLDAMQGDLKYIFKTAGDFVRVMWDLSSEKREAVFDVMKGGLKNIINTAYDFWSVMRALSPEKRAVVFDGMKDDLKGIINTAYDFECVMWELSSEQREAVFNTMQGDLKGIIGTAGDFERVMWPLLPWQRAVVIDTMKDDLKGIIKTVDDFECFTKYRSAEQVAELIQNGEDILSQACSGGSVDLAKVLIDKGVNPTEAMLLQACRDKNLEVVQLLASKLIPDVVSGINQDNLESIAETGLQAFILNQSTSEQASTVKFKEELGGIKPSEQNSEEPSRGPGKI